MALPAPKNLFTPEFVQDPYPTYRKLLDQGPLHYVEVSGGSWPVWAVFGYADCSAATRDQKLSVKRTGRLLLTMPEAQQSEFRELTRMMGMWMIFMDAPEHTRLRKLMNQGFSPAVTEGLRPQVEAVVDRMLERLARGGQADLMQAIANPMPVRVIAGMLGVPETLHGRFIEWSEAIANFMGNPNRTAEHARAAQGAVFALTEFFKQAVAERRRNKGGDLISLLLDIEADGEVLTEEELHAQCVMLLFAGHETTRNLRAITKSRSSRGVARESGNHSHGGGGNSALREPDPIHGAHGEGRGGNLRPAIAERANDSVHAGSGEPRRAAVQGARPAEPETRDQSTSRIWRRRAFLHRESTGAAGGASGDSADGAAVSENAPGDRAAGVGAEFRIQGIEDASGFAVMAGSA